MVGDRLSASVASLSWILRSTLIKVPSEVVSMQNKHCGQALSETVMPYYLQMLPTSESATNYKSQKAPAFLRTIRTKAVNITILHGAIIYASEDTT